MKRNRDATSLTSLWSLAAVLLAACTVPKPSFTFVFTRFTEDVEDGHQDLYLGHYEDGTTTVERLTFSPEWQESSAFSPFGQVVYDPTISPDGQWVLYKLGGVRLDQRLYLFHPVTQERIDLQDYGEVIPGPWSPDGQVLTYVSDHLTGYFQLFLAEIDKLEPRPVPIELEQGYGVVTASWSPDGKELAVGVAPNRFDPDPGPRLIYIYNLNRETLVPLTGEEHGDCRAPDWSPDGRWIVIHCRRADDFGQLYLISPDGRQLKQLTTTPEELQNFEPTFEAHTWIRGRPQWLPDGKHIAYVAQRQPEGPWGLYVSDLNGNAELVLQEHYLLWGMSIQQYPQAPSQPTKAP